MRIFCWCRHVFQGRCKLLPGDPGHHRELPRPNLEFPWDYLASGRRDLCCRRRPHWGQTWPCDFLHPKYQTFWTSAKSNKISIIFVHNNNSLVFCLPFGPDKRRRPYQSRTCPWPRSWSTLGPRRWRHRGHRRWGRRRPRNSQNKRRFDCPSCCSNWSNSRCTIRP